jgi:predicted transcriptional regulator
MLKVIESDKDKWWTAREIENKLKLSASAVYVNLRKLRKTRFVDVVIDSNNVMHFRARVMKDFCF